MNKHVYKYENGILYFEPKSRKSKDVLIQEIQESFEVVPDGVETLYILSDLTKAKFNFTLKEIKEISEATVEAAKRFPLVYDVIIGAGHEEITNIMYFEEMAVTNHYKVKICSTREIGLDWIQKQINQSQS